MHWMDLWTYDSAFHSSIIARGIIWVKPDWDLINFVILIACRCMPYIYEDLHGSA